MTVRPARGRGLAWPLFILCLALGSWVYWALAEDEEPWLPSSAADGQTAPALEPRDDAGFALPELDELSETVERPLFLASRRPIEAPAPEEPPDQSLGEPPAALRGVMISSAERSVLLQFPNRADAVWVAEGATLAGWTVETVEPNQVTLRQGSETRTLLLKDEASPPRRKQPRRRTEPEDGAAGPAETEGEAQKDGAEEQ